MPPPPHPPRHRLSLLLAALAKLACVSQNQLSPPPVLPLTPVTHNLSTLYDPHSHTFTIIDRSNVSLALEPGPGTCSPSTSLVLLVLSALGNTDRRVRLRAEMAALEEQRDTELNGLALKMVELEESLNKLSSDE